MVLFVRGLRSSMSVFVRGRTYSRCVQSLKPLVATQWINRGEHSNISSFSSTNSILSNVQYCALHTAPVALKKKDYASNIVIELHAKESKAEQAVKRLVKQKLEEQKHPSFNFYIDKRSIEEKKVEPKKPLIQQLFTKKYWGELWGKTKHEFNHYKSGFQLFAVDLKISYRLMKKVLNGNKLSRRERTQFVRTAGDIFRLVPFSAFIILPGMELLLPFAIKMFPGMLPSQFQEAKTKVNQQQAELGTKLEMARFLQDTLEDMALKKKGSKGEDAQQSLAEEFNKFLFENRKKGYVSPQSVLKFAPLFNDSLTLDTLEDRQLRAICRLLNLNTLGTTPILRYQIRTKLRALHADDLLISKEGVGSLSAIELQHACRERGMRAFGISKTGLEQRLQHWLDLHITHGVPPTLLLLTRILFLPDNVPEAERIRIVMESLPDALKSQVTAEILEAEGVEVDARLRISIINAEEEKIRREEDEQKRIVEEKAPLPEADTVEVVVEEEKEKDVLIDTAPVVQSILSEDEIAKKMSVELLQINTIVDLAVVLAQLTGHTVIKPEVEALRGEVQHHLSELDDLAVAGDGKLEESVGSKRLQKRVNKLLNKLDESTPEVESDVLRELDLDQDGVISTDELMTAMKMMKNPPTEEQMHILAHALDTDHDGKLNLTQLQQVLRVVTDDGEDVNASSLSDIAHLVEKIDSIEDETKFEREKKKKKQSNSAQE
eukprot:m.50453 g.50453  ORF g.50453 m.50453 type:complete len:719 (+) comp10885_c0_seq1:22-2178(+)